MRESVYNRIDQGFLRKVRKLPVLTKKQEQQDPKESRQDYTKRLIKYNLRMVLHIANTSRQATYLDPEDLFQEGVLALINAAENFDATLGNRFSTYAWIAIRRRIFDYLQINRNLIRWPRDVKPNGETPGTRSVHLVGTARHLIDEIPEDSINKKELNDAVRKVIGTLRPRYQKILEYRYRLQDGDRLLMSEIAKLEGVTTQRIQQIHTNILRNLKKKLLELPPEFFQQYPVYEEIREDQETKDRQPQLQWLSCPEDWVETYKAYMVSHNIPFKEEIKDGDPVFRINKKHRPHLWKLSEPKT